MRYLASSIVVCCFLLAANAAQDDPAKKELASLEGSWQAVSIMERGKALPEADVKGFKLIFKGNKVAIAKGPGKADEASVKLDPSKNPKAIDVTPLDGPGSGTPILGIYSMVGDSLKICFVHKGERPTEFKAGKDGILFELKREKR